MQQPEGFLVKRKEKLVCRLTKSLYGLKQAPMQCGTRSLMDLCRGMATTSAMLSIVVTSRGFKSNNITLLLYVDDMLVAGSDMDEIQMLKKQLSSEFNMKDLGAAKQILGMRIKKG